MNRDLRIGLSLSLLALGVAGAFCFRADPAAVDPALAGVEADADAADAPPDLAPPPPPVRLAPPATPPAVAAAPVGPPPLPVPAVGPPPVLPPAAPLASAETLPPFPEPLDEFPEEPAPPPAEPQTYTVAPGDTLTGIAERTLGSHRKYHAIYEANRDVLEHPDALRVGMTLRIPDRL
ncbi:LysM peptidoglycan-binding domain-containing protein [Alienimonas sp. DA493]|uniref:LysM peptidoglycan-binding domain-containing protein n=1 Tax=Alienimonas sp. DA493 TaxID=3373605 RepID=UPI003754D804